MFALIVQPAQQSVIAVFATRREAEEAVRDLDVGSFPLRQVSMVSGAREKKGLIVTGSLSRALFDSIEEVLRGAGAGGFLRGLMAWGVTGDEVSKCEELVRAGRTLLICHGSVQQAANAHRILRANGETALQIHGCQPAEAPLGSHSPWTRLPARDGVLVRENGPRWPERENSW
jgi:hypothetical protein